MFRLFGKNVVMLSLVTPLLLAAKCDGVYESMRYDAGVGGSENQQTAGAKSDGVSGSANGGSKSGGGAGVTNGGSDGGSCESYRDDVSGTAATVTVRVKNSGDAPIHLGPSEQTCEYSMPYFEITADGLGTL